LLLVLLDITYNSPNEQVFFVDHYAVNNTAKPPHGSAVVAFVKDISRQLAFSTHMVMVSLNLVIFSLSVGFPRFVGPTPNVKKGSRTKMRSFFEGFFLTYS